MIREPGRVIAVEDGGVWVETVRKSTCGSCSVQKACGHGLMNAIKTGESHSVLVPLDNSMNSYAINDDVELAVSEGALVKSALIVYFSPLLTMLVGALLGSLLNYGDISAVIGALIGFSVGIGFVKTHSESIGKDKRFSPVISHVDSHVAH